jgi:hypothetical protein
MKTAGLHLYAIAEAVHCCGFEGNFLRLQHWSCAAGHADAVDLLLVPLRPLARTRTHRLMTGRRQPLRRSGAT